MKRFIDLGNQTKNIDFEAGEKEFAFYDTCTDKFEEFSGAQTWSSKQDFIDDFPHNGELERYLKLIPEDWK